MDVLLIPIFISIFFVMGALVCYLYLMHRREFDFSDQIALMPLEEMENADADHIIQKK